MPFVKFTDTGRTLRPAASITPNGVISLNSGARRTFCLKEYGYAILYLDKERGMVGIELSNDPAAEGARPLRVRQTTCDIRARSFVEQLPRRIEKTTKFPLRKDPETGFLVIDLREGQERTSRARKSKKTEGLSMT